MEGDPSGAALIVGGSGYIGSLVAAALLIEEGRRLLMPIRSTTGVDECHARLRLSLSDYGAPLTCIEELLRLVTVAELPPLGSLRELDHAVASIDVDEIIHCAGCLDYFDKRRLQLANVELTARLLDAAHRWKLRRFFYVSTAYCAGYRQGPIPERLHPDPPPENEPTEYTRTKRAAEWLVAESGVPFVIVRPSIVIGDSRTGIYRGSNYGLYQTWRAWEGLIGPHYSPVWHAVAPPVPLNLVHQDAFQAAFLAVRRALPPGAVIHIVSKDTTSPTLRDICWLWADVYLPSEIYCYRSIDDVAFPSLPTRQRRFLELVAKNLEIATHRWEFVSDSLDRLRRAGLHFVDATVETLGRCQKRYVDTSPRLQDHLRQYAGRRRVAPRFIEVPTCSPAMTSFGEARQS